MKLKSICHAHGGVVGRFTTHGAEVTSSNWTLVLMPTKDRKAKPGPTQPDTMVAVAWVTAELVLSVTWHGGNEAAAAVFPLFDDVLGYTTATVPANNSPMTSAVKAIIWFFLKVPPP